jgi:hypothetical protein
MAASPMKGKGGKTKRPSRKRSEIGVPGWVTNNVVQVMGVVEQLPYQDQLASFLLSIDDRVLDYLNRLEHPFLHVLLLGKFEELAEQSGKELQIDRREDYHEYFEFLLGVEELRRKEAAALDSYPVDLFQVSRLTVDFHLSSIGRQDLSPHAARVLAAGATATSPLEPGAKQWRQ